MIKFLFKGLIRDRHRSVLPIIVVILGVMLTVFMQAYLTGVFGDMVDMNARFETGHIKVMTAAYADDADQMPNDLALINTDELVMELEKEFPGIKWTPRIRFAGLIDIPDEDGETRAQGPGVGWALDLLNPQSQEINRFNLEKSLVRGEIPDQPGEALLSDQFAEKLKVEPGDQFTFFGSAATGGMAFYNFILSGTVSFGTNALDKGAVIIDLEDARQALDMPDGAGELLGYFQDGHYHDELANDITRQYNSENSTDDDPFAPQAYTLKELSILSSFLDFADNMMALIVSIFVIAMSVVLWNAGLLGGLRRYGEVGVRLAMGETKSHVYKSMIIESVLIGIIGSVIGSGIGLALSFWMQNHGIDISGMMQNNSIMMPSVFKSRVTTATYYIGFIPGVFATVLGTMLAGIGIYKRKTARLFKELES
jgi:putative ABC transport system permease protein